jgi:Ser/Thr protein kinase RdoA (MazF antagonist)
MTMDLARILDTWPVLGSNVENLGEVGKAVHLLGSSGHYFLKRRPSAEHAAREAGVLGHLRDQGLPVPEHVRTVRGEPFASASAMGREVSCLYRALPGAHYETFDGKDGVIHARQVGKALGRLHLALAEVPSMPGFERYGPEANLSSELASVGDVYDLPRLERISARRSPSAQLPEQLIHRDFHLYNLLFSDGRPSGYLDFDMLMRGPRLFDVCYCSIETLAKRFDEPSFPDYWFRILGAIIKGYAEHVLLTELERRSVFSLMMEIELLFMHYFRAEPIPGKNAERVLYWLDERRHLIQSVVQSV